MPARKPHKVTTEEMWEFACESWKTLACAMTMDKTQRKSLEVGAGQKRFHVTRRLSVQTSTANVVCTPRP